MVRALLLDAIQLAVVNAHTHIAIFLFREEYASTVQGFGRLDLFGLVRLELLLELLELQRGKSVNTMGWWLGAWLQVNGHGGKSLDLVRYHDLNPGESTGWKITASR